MTRIFSSFSIESLRRSRKGILLMLCSSLFVALGQMFWKMFQGMGFSSQGMITLLLGFILYSAGAVVMISAFRFGELSVLHPFLSASYVFAVIIGFFVLHEKISVLKLCSIAVIGFGLILLGVGTQNER